MSLWVASIASSLLLPLAVWILINGVDDLFVDLMGLLAWLDLRRTPEPGRRELLRHRQKRIAIFIPCWHESAVIARMIEKNRERIIYLNYDFFIGAYPNDEETLDVLHDLEARLPNVHLALVPHDGPTSKADCLNWIYERMLLFEQTHHIRFDVAVTHDAEDVIHADSLHWINWYADRHSMIQIPVLPLKTPLTHWTHGVYCDEFSEYQSRDMPARQFMGAFVPSNGVGTGFTRAALEGLAHSENNRIFEPACLTEDYENGLRLHLRGASQVFVRVSSTDVSTREYFPQTLGTAVRQRRRWITGIALQTWERHSFPGRPACVYWLWRDRKGLLGNPASLLANVLFAYGILVRHPVFLQRVDTLAPILGCTAFIGVYRIGFRAWSVAARFGWQIAVGVPIRSLLANGINTLATLGALKDYAVAHWKNEPLRWSKTEHQYPGAAALQPEHISFRDLLVRTGYVTQEQLEQAEKSLPAGQKIGERLVELEYITQDDLYDALSLQTRLPHTQIAPEEIRPSVARSLPRQIVSELAVMPFRVEDGKLWIATPDIPAETTRLTLEQFTSLEIRFHLVKPEAFIRLTASLN